MNPTIDVSYEVERMVDTIKMRAVNERYAPGGGGINVARVLSRLGAMARCIYLSGGATGPALDGLLDQHELQRTHVTLAGATRMATTVLERSSGKEFRFTPAGPQVSEAEWQACLQTLREVDCGTVVMSGSLPPGVPQDFYARAARILQARGIETVLDSSREPLRLGLEAGGHLLIKPNQTELAQLTGTDPDSINAVCDAASSLVAEGVSRYVVASLGERGAVFADADGAIHHDALKVEARSAVGAGDSFVAGMVFRLTQGSDPHEAFRYGLAAGSAAVLTPGTGLAYLPDIEALFSSL